MIWLPKYKDIVLANSVAFSGQYRLVVSEADGHVVQDTGWFDNIITNFGLDNLAGGPRINVCSLGTGTNPALASDTTLQTFAQFSDSAGPGNAVLIPPSGNNTVSPYQAGIARVYRFSIGSLNDTYREVGVSNTTNGSSLFSRALIVDSGGALSSVTVTSAQQLDVTYRLFKYAPLVDVTNNITIGGVSYVVTGRAMNAGNPEAWRPDYLMNIVHGTFELRNSGSTLGTLTSAGPTAGANYLAASISAPTISSPTARSRAAACRFNTDTGNLPGGIKTASMGWGQNGQSAQFQYSFNNPVPKDVNKTMVLNLQISWERF